MMAPKLKPWRVDRLASGVLGALLLLSVLGAPAANGQTAYVAGLQSLHTADYGISRPSALAFSPEANVLLLGGPRDFVLSQSLYTATIDPWGLQLEGIDLPLPPAGRLHMAFSRRANALFVLDAATGKAVMIPAAPGGRLRSSGKPVVAFNKGDFGIVDARGLAVDSRTGDLYVLDGVGPSVVRITPGPDQSFAGATWERFGLLGLPDQSQLQAMAFNPVEGHLFVVNVKNDLYELDNRGALIASRDLASLGLKHVSSVVSAPSADLTDDPSILNLFVLDTGEGKVPERTSARIVELSLVAPVLAATTLAAPTLAPSLIRTIVTGGWSPASSPDPAGVVFISGCPAPGILQPAAGNYLVCDSEVEESNFVSNGIWKGFNLFEMNTFGALLATYTTYPKFNPATSLSSREPTGLSFNANNCHIFISDDSARRVWEINVGPDGRYGTADDLVTWIDTTAFGNTDPEDVAYDSARNILFVAGGSNAEVYKVSPGPNGIFDGVPPAGDDQVTQFDTSALGVSDLEGLGYNPGSNTLYLVGPQNRKTVVEATTDGVAVRIFDITGASALSPSDVDLGPGTWSGNGRSIYVSDRMVDNGSNPNENDGRIYEYDLGIPVIDSFTPSSGSPGTEVTISGGRFTGASGVAFNGAPAAYTVDSGSQIRATVPVGAASGPISVTNSAGAGGSSGAFTVSADPSHDVAVTQVNAPSPVNVGQQQTVVVTVVNQGTFSETFSVTLTDPAEAITPPSQSVTLTAGASQAVNFAWTPTATGTHTLTATASTVTGETDTADNTNSATSVVNLHDVAVTQLTAPSPANANQAQTVTVTVANQGTVQETFTVSLVDNQAAAIAPSSQNVTLGAGASQSVNFSWTPAATGQHTLTGTASTVAGETDTADNTSSATPVVNLHDVAVTSVSAPSPVEMNQAQTVTVTVANQGSVQETFTVTLSDNLAATISNAQQVTVGAAGSQPVDFTWTPTATGTHTLTATASAVSGEVDTGNNTRTASSTVIAHDVAVTSVSAPSPVEVNQQQTVSVTVANQGTVSETFTVALGDNQAATITPSSPSVTLAAGTSQVVNFAWTPTATGSHTLTATASTVTGETDTTDNTKATTSEVSASLVHDVAVTQVSAPTPVGVSQPQTVTVTVGNEGTAAETFTVTLSDNLAATISPSSQSVTLGAGASQPVSFTWTPAVTGTHTLTATASTVTGETDTTDNTNSATSEVTAPLVHDVAVTQVSAPTPVGVIQPQTVSVTVTNEGSLPETFTVTLSDNLAATITPSPQNVASLGAGANTTLTFTWTPTVTGSHTLTATASTVAGETDTTDNTKSVTSQVNATPVISSFTPASGPVGIEVKITGRNFTGVTAVFFNGTPAASFMVDSRRKIRAYVPSGATTGPISITNSAGTGASSASFDVTTLPNGASVVEKRITASSDDAEERVSTGSVGLTSGDLELIQASAPQTIGLRFTGLAIPQGATIVNAYVQFEADEVSSGTADLVIEGEAAGDALTFTTAKRNISSRPRTSGVTWGAVPDWTAVGQAGPAQRTPDLTIVVREIVNQSTWSGNSLVLIITGSGRRVAESFNGDPPGAPLLHVEFVP